MADNLLQNNSGLFLPTTFVFETNEIYSVDVNSPAFKELLVRLYQNVNYIALALNLKDSGYYMNNQEFVTGAQFFPNPAFTSSTAANPDGRQVYRSVINFGALPNTATKSVAHNIPVNSGFTFTRIYGCSSDTTGLSYLPLPYASPTLVNNIELNADGTNVNITTGSNRTAYTITYVILEYIKN